MRGITGLGTPIAILALVALPFAVRASEDGGTQSPFATGAGNRALAMGGAYTALADDPSAPGWNPAGLGRLDRRALQAARASLYGLDTTEEYASFGWPSWRWGAVALAVRRLGTEAIERRDDRNLLLGEFDASEMEIGLAWGRTVGEAWCLGGGVKVARQEIDGRSDNGFGADLGVLVRPGPALGYDSAWLRRMTVGLSARNVIAPSIRLDEASVSEPTEVRAGVAYVQELPGGRSLQMAADVATAHHVGASLRAGLELSPHPLLALRGGWNGRGLTAGAGIRWRDNSFDYVLEDNPIEVVHRFGVTLAFGPTVADSRAAARAAEEAEFGRRLDEIFATREEARFRELLERGRGLLAEQRLDEAADAAASARALHPDDPRPRALEAACLAAQAAQRHLGGELADALILYGRALVLTPEDADIAGAAQRCREESDLRQERTVRIRGLYGEALDAFAAGDLLRARERLQAMREIAPEDADGQTLLVRTEAAIVTRVAELVQQARQATTDGRFREAEDRLAAARSLDASDSALGAATERLRRAVREAESRATSLAAATDSSGTPKAGGPTVAAPTLSRKKQREIADLYLRGVEAAQGGRSEDAIRYWELVWGSDPAYESVAEFLKREYLLRGLDSFSHGALDEAIRTWEKAREVDPTDERTQGYLARAREQRDRSRQILGDR